MFQPNPVRLVVPAKLTAVKQEHCKDVLTKISFGNASAPLQFWPEDKFGEKDLALVIGWRQDAVHRLPIRYWSLDDRGPADGARVEKGHARIAKLTFHGEKFTSEYVDPLFKQLATGGKVSKPDKQSQSLYDAFVAGETIQFYVKLGELEDESKKAGKEHPYYASLLIRLRYRQA